MTTRMKFYMERGFAMAIVTLAGLLFASPYLFLTLSLAAN